MNEFHIHLISLYQRVPCSSDRIVLELWDAQTRISTAYLRYEFSIFNVYEYIQFIAYIRFSFEAILKGEMKPTWVNFYSETQRRRESRYNILTCFYVPFSVCFLCPIFCPIRRESLGAFAAFAALFELDDEEEEADTATEFLYLGRILVSACCVKHKSPPCRSLLLQLTSDMYCHTLAYIVMLVVCIACSLAFVFMLMPTNCIASPFDFLLLLVAAQSHPCRPVEPPHSQEYTLWGDLFDISGLHKIVDTSVLHINGR